MQERGFYFPLRKASTCIAKSRGECVTNSPEEAKQETKEGIDAKFQSDIGAKTKQSYLLFFPLLTCFTGAKETKEIDACEEEERTAAEGENGEIEALKKLVLKKIWSDGRGRRVVQADQRLT